MKAFTRSIKRLKMVFKSRAGVDADTLRMPYTLATDLGLELPELQNAVDLIIITGFIAARVNRVMLSQGDHIMEFEHPADFWERNA